MSTSCVLRSVVTLDLPHGRRILRDRMATAPASRARRLPRRGRPLHRRARRGVLPPLRGPEGELRARADLRALRRADDARGVPASSRRARRGGGAASVELWRFACEGYLGNLTRERRRGDRRARGDARRRPSTARRSRYRMLRADDRERAGPRAARAARARRASSSTEEHLNPRYLDAGRVQREGDARARRADLPRALRALRLPARRARRAVPRLPRRDRGPLRGRVRPALPRAASASALEEARALRRPARSSARSEWDDGFPGRPDAARARGTLAGPRHRPATRRRTSTSTSSRGRRRPRARSARRSRCPSASMLVIQPIGGPDDWHALFHEAGHTEHFAHTSRRPPGRGAAARRQRGHRGLGDAARAPRQRPGLARRGGSTSRGRDEFAAEARGRAPLLRPPLLRRSSSTSSSSTRDDELDGDARALRRAARRRD